MNKENLKKPIVLVGLMGVGKTTLGKMLADYFQSDFFDVDDVIVEEQGKPIPQIFSDEGEQFFRDVEAETIRRLVSKGSCVISTGGGAMMREITQELILSKSVSVWIHSSPSVLLNRIGKDENRPLLQGDDPLSVLKKLEKERIAVYRRADIHVESGDETLEVTFEKILNKLDAVKFS
ncbi:MAG: shikimate kinase [Bdellovibrionales bacterium]